MAISPVTLTGRHVRLEPLTAEHLDALARHGADAELWRYMLYARPDPLDGLRAWYEKVSGGAARGELLAFAVIDLARGEAVGGTTMFDIIAAHKRLEIGSTWLGRAVWRTAVNTEAKFLLLSHAFETMGMNRVQLVTDARNERSRTAIARIGARPEGILRAHMVMPDGVLRDTAVFSVIASEWPAVKARLAERLGRA